MGRFYKTKQVTPADYMYKISEDLVTKAMETHNEGFKEQLDEGQKATGLLSELESRKQDQEYLGEVMNEFNQREAGIVEGMHKDPASYGKLLPETRKLSRDISTSMESGPIRNITKALEQEKEVNALIEKTEGLSEERARVLKEANASRFDKAGGARKGLNYSDYAQQSKGETDLNALYKDIGVLWNEETNSWETSDEEGDFIRKRGATTEEIKESDIDKYLDKTFREKDGYKDQQIQYYESLAEIGTYEKYNEDSETLEDDINERVEAEIISAKKRGMNALGYKSVTSATDELSGIPGKSNIGNRRNNEETPSSNITEERNNIPDQPLRVQESAKSEEVNSFLAGNVELREAGISNADELVNVITGRTESNLTYRDLVSKLKNQKVIVKGPNNTNVEKTLFDGPAEVLEWANLAIQARAKYEPTSEKEEEREALVTAFNNMSTTQEIMFTSKDSNNTQFSKKCTMASLAEEALNKIVGTDETIDPSEITFQFSPTGEVPVPAYKTKKVGDVEYLVNEEGGILYYEDEDENIHKITSIEEAAEHNKEGLAVIDATKTKATFGGKNSLYNTDINNLKKIDRASIDASGAVRHEYQYVSTGTLTILHKDRYFNVEVEVSIPKNRLQVSETKK